jgi:hypothetical protein
MIPRASFLEYMKFWMAKEVAVPLLIVAALVLIFVGIVVVAYVQALWRKVRHHDQEEP